MLEGAVPGRESYKEIGSRDGKHGPLPTTATVFSNRGRGGGEQIETMLRLLSLFAAVERHTHGWLCMT